MCKKKSSDSPLKNVIYEVVVLIIYVRLCTLTSAGRAEKYSDLRLNLWMEGQCVYVEGVAVGGSRASGGGS